jgi:tetrahydromethanopterin S-methyltransferase subunit G
MEAMRESWTDDRLDRLNGKVDALRVEMRTEFKAIRGETRSDFKEVRGEMREEFAAVRGEMRAGFDKIDSRFETIEGRFDALQRTLLQIAGGTIATLIAGFAGIIATQL